MFHEDTLILLINRWRHIIVQTTTTNHLN